MKLVASFLLSSIAILAQTQTVTQFFYDGSGNSRYTCVAPLNLPYTSSQPVSVSIPVVSPISIATSTLTNIVVSGGTATVTVPSTSPWNAATYAEMQVTVSGSATSALNGNYIITSSNTTTTTFTFTTTAGNATYTDATLKISTSNPILTQVGWNLIVFSYSSTNQTTGAFVINTGFTFPCSSRTNY